MTLTSPPLPHLHTPSTPHHRVDGWWMVAGISVHFPVARSQTFQYIGPGDNQVTPFILEGDGVGLHRYSSHYAASLPNSFTCTSGTDRSQVCSTCCSLVSLTRHNQVFSGQSSVRKLCSPLCHIDSFLRIISKHQGGKKNLPLKIRLCFYFGFEIPVEVFVQGLSFPTRSMALREMCITRSQGGVCVEEGGEGGFDTWKGMQQWQKLGLSSYHENLAWCQVHHSWRHVSLSPAAQPVSGGSPRVVLLE